MTLLFDSLPLRDVTLKNRIIISPMLMYRAEDDGQLTDWHLAHYGRFALGGAAMVVLESCAVEARGRISHACLGLWNDDQIEPYTKLTALMTSLGCVPALQLNHSGRKGSWRQPWDGYSSLTEADAERGERPWPLIAPSPLAVSETASSPAELTRADMDELVAAWVSAARRAEQAGFRMLEVHSAHGYLLHQFLSPISNQRTDEYGGSLANRMRFPLEIVRAIREACGDGLPLSVRISAVDGVDGGWSLDDTVAYSHALKEAGVDVIDCSSGGIGGSATLTRVPRGPGFQVGYAQRVRQEVDILTIAVGLITTGEQAAEVVDESRADIVAVGRQALVDPNWPLTARMRLVPTDGHVEWPRETGWWLDKREESLRA